MSSQTWHAAIVNRGWGCRDGAFSAVVGLAALGAMSGIVGSRRKSRWQQALEGTGAL